MLHISGLEIKSFFNRFYSSHSLLLISSVKKRKEKKNAAPHSPTFKKCYFLWSWRAHWTQKCEPEVPLGSLAECKREQVGGEATCWFPVTPQPCMELPSQQGSMSVGNPSFATPLRRVVISKGPVSTAYVSPLETQMKTLHFFPLSISVCWIGPANYFHGGTRAEPQSEYSDSHMEYAIEVTHFKLARWTLHTPLSTSNLNNTWYLWWVDSGQLPDSHPAALSFPLLNRMVENIRWKGSWLR